MAAVEIFVRFPCSFRTAKVSVTARFSLGNNLALIFFEDAPGGGGVKRSTSKVFLEAGL